MSADTAPGSESGLSRQSSVYRRMMAVCDKLAAAAGGETSIEVAIHDYEQQMRDYGFAAVAASRQAEQLTAARSGGRGRGRGVRGPGRPDRRRLLLGNPRREGTAVTA